MDKISILIATYQRPVLLDRALMSIVNSSIDKNLIEIVILSDGDIAADAAETENTISKYRDKFEIRYFCNSENKGIGYTRNRLLDLVRTSYLTFLDADDEFGPEFLKIAFYNLNGYDMLVGDVRSRYSIGIDMVYPGSFQLYHFGNDKAFWESCGGFELIFQGRVYKTEVFNSEPRIRCPEVETGEDLPTVYCTKFKVKKFIDLSVLAYIKYYLSTSLTCTKKITYDTVQMMQEHVGAFVRINNIPYKFYT